MVAILYFDPHKKLQKSGTIPYSTMYSLCSMIICVQNHSIKFEGLSWLWSYGSWIYNYLCNQWSSPLMWDQIPLMVRCTQYNIMWQVCLWLAACWLFSPVSPPITHYHDITEILLKMALKTIILIPNPSILFVVSEFQ